MGTNVPGTNVLGNQCPRTVQATKWKLKCTTVKWKPPESEWKWKRVKMGESESESETIDDLWQICGIGRWKGSGVGRISIQSTASVAAEAKPLHQNVSMMTFPLTGCFKSDQHKSHTGWWVDTWEKDSCSWLWVKPKHSSYIHSPCYAIVHKHNGCIIIRVKE